MRHSSNLWVAPAAILPAHTRVAMQYPHLECFVWLAAHVASNDGCVECADLRLQALEEEGDNMDT